MESEPLNLSISTLSQQRLQRAATEAGGMAPLVEHLVSWIARQPDLEQQKILDEVLSSTSEAPVVYTEMTLPTDDHCGSS